MKKNGLFRHEVLEHQKHRWQGKVLISGGIPVPITVALSVSFIVTLIAFCLFANYARRIEVNGEVVTFPGAVNISAPQRGFISKTFAQPGDQVHRGDRLYQLNVSKETEGGRLSDTARQALTQQIEQMDEMVIQLQNNKQRMTQDLQSQRALKITHLNNIQTLIDAAKQGVHEMAQNRRNYIDYQKRGLINRDQQINQSRYYYEQQNTYLSLLGQASNETQQIAMLDSQIVTQGITIDNQISQLKVNRLDLQMKLMTAQADGTLYITSGSNGLLESMSATPGQMVNAGDSLAQINPGAFSVYSLIFWVPSSSAPYIKPGDTVKLRYVAFPWQKYGQFPGRITSIARLPASAQEMASYANNPQKPGVYSNQSWYKVIVSIDNEKYGPQGSQLKVTSGMAVQATLFLDKRTIYQWLFSPWYDALTHFSGTGSA